MIESLSLKVGAKWPALLVFPLAQIGLSDALSAIEKLTVAGSALAFAVLVIRWSDRWSDRRQAAIEGDIARLIAEHDAELVRRTADHTQCLERISELEQRLLDLLRPGDE